ncbi:restriction endonuclease subunit S [Nitrosovibrio sp. Nv17]|uniref:restriction endonuclease subunit S n=1 Tax=Nitrosovibrio sp. Nv17 TaxID=1855339 RepID=UPI000908A520|nr:restriction endonuclease subunit S [Nitrosovibrio sp. Nv17]SFW21503.1 type I restriction enzyme, S subunit [Nitrosovibrio sp. Nv17]
MSDWHETTLGKICEKQGGSVQTGPFGSQLHASDYTVVGTPVVMPMNLVDGNIDDQGIARISDKNVSRLAKHKLVRGDIVFSRRGDVTRFALVSDREAGWLCGTGCLKISIGNPTIATPDFIATVLASPNSKEWLIRHAVGATMPNLNTAILENVPITLLPIEEQRAIAHILGTLDDKIELNRRMNLTLEAMARALFKSWFVDFEPVRAKAEDRDPGLPNEIADLFPSRLVDSALGEIPEGWEIAPVSKLIDFNPNEPLRKGELAPYLDMASLPTAGSWPKAPIIRPFGSGMRFRNGDTLLARITPCLENGKTAFIQCLPDGVVGWGSTEYIVMRPKPPVPPEFAYLLARHPAFREQAIKSMTGTSGRQRAQGESVAAFKLVAPTGEKLWHAFARFVVPVFQNIKSHSETSLTLAVLRDTLLRRLISGEMRVNGLIKEVRP